MAECLFLWDVEPRFQPPAIQLFFNFLSGLLSFCAGRRCRRPLRGNRRRWTCDRRGCWRWIYQLRWRKYLRLEWNGRGRWKGLDWHALLIHRKVTFGVMKLFQSDFGDVAFVFDVRLVVGFIDESCTLK